MHDGAVGRTGYHIAVRSRAVENTFAIVEAGGADADTDKILR
jgi:hypothetical protein